MTNDGLPPLPARVSVREVGPRDGLQDEPPYEGHVPFESSFGELGGCPVPPGSTGNIATEDLVSMLHEMGVATGVDLDALLEVSRDVQRVLGRPLGSHLLTAGPVVWNASRPLLGRPFVRYEGQSGL